MDNHRTATRQRILIGLRDVAGFGSTLKNGFDQIGIASDFLSMGGSQFEYPSTSSSPIIQFLNQIGTLFGQKFTANFPLRFLWLVAIQPFFSLLALPYVLWRYDSFIFISNSTFFFFLELPLMRMTGKKIIYVFLGSDSRPTYLNGYVTGLNPTRFKMMACFGIALAQKCVIRIIELFAHEVVNTPPQALFHKRSFLNLFQIGLPTYLSNAKEISREHSSTLRVLHAPSKSAPKRSIQIERIIHELLAEGHSLEYVRIEGRPNSEVLHEIANCDLVIDEVYSDTPLSKFASEAASYGKPALVGSYYATSIELDLPRAYVPPSFFSEPEELKSKFKNILLNPDSRRELGQTAKTFIHEQWAAPIVAKKFVQILNGTAPELWRFSPNKLQYIHGCGLAESEIKKNLRILYSTFGRYGFLMAHRPILEERLLALMRQH